MDSAIDVGVLTVEEKRIRIAEACGWYDFGATAPERGSLEPRIIGRFKERMDRHIIPDFLNDLNACAAMEKVLTDTQVALFGEWLRETINKTSQTHLQLMPLYSKMPWTGTDVYRIARATAPQRCEAFGKTLNLW